MVYTAQSRALAALEMLAHLESVELLAEYVMLEVSIDEPLVTEIPVSALPRGWQAMQIPDGTRAIGDAWVKRNESVALRVPSALVPGEWNYLLNPRHPDYGRLRMHSPVGFRFDSRLIRKR
jgi:RES domain-containing protein